MTEWIQRKDANHILRHLSTELEWIARTHCKHCRKRAFDEINMALKNAEDAIWKLKTRTKKNDHRSS